MKKETVIRKWIGIVSIFVLFFVVVSFVTTCCLMLFTTTLQDSVGRAFTQEELTAAAKVTMLNVILISIAMVVIERVWRKLAIERPVKRITEATEKMMKGDFSVRIRPTAKLSAEDSFGDVIRCINQMAQELSGVETLRTDFVVNVSHEMKTPLAVMQNYGTLLQEPNLSEEKRMEYAKAITEASRRLANMMTNILKLNRLENQQIYPQSERYNLGEQLCECLLQFENTWESKGIEIDTDIRENVWVVADSELLSLVWNNLFSNAFKFTENGGRVTLALSVDGHDAVVQVTDTGCGMSAEVGAHIFEKFYQGDTSHATQGNGLGLALVKRVVDIMHGTIAVDSTVGEGTTFTVKIRRDLNELEEAR